MKAFMIGAPMTGAGKTTLTLGMLAAFKGRGMRVQPFKAGPDFIDPGLHALAAGIPSHNLDGWMLSAETNRYLFDSSCVHADIAIVEGMMGLFDGFDGKSNAGSSAELAGWLDLPVILVLDASAMARSVGALLHGFHTFDPLLRLAGVIFNRVGGEGHFKILKDAVGDTPVLGWLPANPEVEIAERHLGLMTGQEPQARERIVRIGEFVEEHLDLEYILAQLPDRPVALPAAKAAVAARKTVRVALANDRAFSFYYQANRIALEQCGGHIVEFSPLADVRMPDADLLYLGGGYPELYRSELEENSGMRASVKDFIESGGRVYAECGGLMYLASEIEGHAMVGVLRTAIRMLNRPVNFGYSEVTTLSPTILGPAGTRVRGHQFHYSACAPESADPVYAVVQGGRHYGEGFRLKNGIASYVHLHFLSNPSIVSHVLES